MLNQQNNPVFSTIPSALSYYASTQKHKIAFRYLESGEVESGVLTYEQLNAEADRIAHILLDHCKKGDRALLLYPQGLDFVTALMACFKAGVVAVPISPPSSAKRTERMKKVVADCLPTIAIGNALQVHQISLWFEKQGIQLSCPWVSTDGVTPNVLHPLPEIGSSDAAILQYTSGSTGSPKGVVLTHDNLVHNNHELYLASNCATEMVCWLPMYHDMGLVGNIVYAVYCGGTQTLFSPVDFVRKPIRWLQAISKYKATASGGPNFAYDLCSKHIRDEELEGIDLSQWQAAINGAEPIKPDTIAHFAKRFSKVGFHEASFVPCYGMAEATALVTGKRDSVHTIQVDEKVLGRGKFKLVTEALPNSRLRNLCSSGPVAAGMQLKIVNPDTFLECKPDEIGEIWIKGRSVAPGYWQQPELTQQLFKARIASADDEDIDINAPNDKGNWLRSGDMGFLHNGLLYVTGRLKEIIIVNGINLYPSDLERIVQNASKELEVNAGAVFGVPGPDGSEVVIAFQELERNAVNSCNTEKLISTIAKSIQESTDAALSGIYLLMPGSLPKTSSGKIQRLKCAEAYATQKMQGVIASWDINKTTDNSTITKKQTRMDTPVNFEAMKRNFDNIIASLADHAEKQPDKRAYLYLIDGEIEGPSLTYKQLYNKSRNIALHLAKVTTPGDRAILLFPPGLDFITSFYGCLMAGVVAVPMYPPTGKRRLGRLEHVSIDCDAHIFLSLSPISTVARDWFSDVSSLKDLNWLDVDKLEKLDLTQALPEINPADIAFLQYTSGSTGDPKGVEVTHANLIHNPSIIVEAGLGCMKVVSWLPIYHDMGLIGKVVLMAYNGGELVLMSPVDFIRKPVRWLQAISKYGIEACAAPNFAYDLCVSDISDEEMQGLDLSTWVSSFNGSEPIKAQTIKRFNKKFAACGLKENVILPCYGMAETTLIVSGRNSAIEFYAVDSESLKANKIKPAEKDKPSQELAASGPVLRDTKVVIVHPDSKMKCAPDEVGEIWVQGLSVARGYWRKPEKTKELFEAEIVDEQGNTISEEGKFLRTGDLGFLHNGMLYITGRIKEIIIINGANYYPQDIEETIQAEVPGLRLHAGAAFTVPSESGTEQLFIFQELDREKARDFDAEEIFQQVREAVYTEHLIPVSGIFLISPGKLPKTTSGKIQRLKCAEAYTEQNIDGAMASWDVNAISIDSAIEQSKTGVDTFIDFEAMKRNFPNLIDSLADHAENQPDKRAYLYLIDGETEGPSLTYKQLYIKSRNIALHLKKVTAPGDRALLLFPPGLEFITSFFGCLMAGVVAVPMYPPTGKRRLSRLAHVSKDCDARIALSINAVSTVARGWFSDFSSLKDINWLDVDKLEKLDLTQSLPAIKPENTAFLQYTSGSTGNPKGVEVTHANLMHNPSIIVEAGLGCMKAVSWLPIYHDMGLIGKVVLMAYNGGELVLMSPVDFIRKPVRWLRAISKYGSQICAAPNFAYDLCVSDISEEELKGLDLSSWVSGFNGSEPIKARTIRNFTKKFAPCGLKENVILPCYGMAETTLIVSGRNGAIDFFNADAASLQANKVKPAESGKPSHELAASGPVLRDTKVVIVHPDSKKRCAPDEVGEIWIQGLSVTRGYWRKPELTQEKFGAEIIDELGNTLKEEGKFLRTGDLGFLHSGMLYITGRIKEIIIINGANYYPQDIEETIQTKVPGMRLHSGAAFAVPSKTGTEQLFVFQELDREKARKFDADEIFQQIRDAVFNEHRIPVSGIYLISPVKLPKTTSGKIRRTRCRKMVLEGEVPIALAEWTASEGSSVEKVASPSAAVPEKTPALSADSVAKMLQSAIAKELNLDPAVVDLDTSFARLGLSSVKGIQLTSKLSASLQAEIKPTDLYDYSTIRELAAYIAEIQGGKKTVAKEAEAPTASPNDYGDDPIAVIGMSCRFPGADNTDAYWDMLVNGKDAVAEIPSSRWKLEEYYSENQQPGKMVTKWGGFIEDVDLFDATFFEISPKEAISMDPQQRLLLQETYKLMEQSGYPSADLKGKDVGVFIGIAGSDYAGITLKHHEERNIYTATGSSYSIVANRLSYFFDLRGPSVALDTACSSSLVSIHLAAQAIKSGECSMAIAGGVNLILTPEGTLSFSESGLMATDGHCKTFDANANGIVRSDGCGVVMLKPLSVAQRDGDHIHAVIKGSAVNQDGRSNGLTAPNGRAQQACVRKALESSALTAKDIRFVETHGTGTVLGDPIEVNALNAVYGEDRDNKLLLGSVKANMGHLEAAAGIAGFIKAVLAVQHRQLPKQIHFTTPNPQIDWSNASVEVATNGYNFDQSAIVAAGVSSFGFGGTNAHIIVASAPKNAAKAHVSHVPSGGYHLLPVSAKDNKALRQKLIDLDKFLDRNASISLANLAYTLAAKRDHFKQRAVVFGTDVTSVRKGIAELLAGEESLNGYSNMRLQGIEKRAFLFTGAGPQYPGMGRSMYHAEPIFAEALDAAVQVANKYLEKDLKAVIFCEKGSEMHTLLDRIDYMQPAVFAYEYAMYQWWKSIGVTAEVVIGHSLGELVAACVADVLPLEDAMKLAVKRGELIYNMPVPGTMASIQASEKEIIEAIGARKGVSVAVLNSPIQTVVAGEVPEVEAIVAHFEAEGRKTKILNISRAGHSPLMDAITEPFREVLKGFKMQAAQIPLISNVSGKQAEADIATPDYWVQHLRQPVRFFDGLNSLQELSANVLIEVGPNPVLLGISSQSGTPQGAVHISSANAEDVKNSLPYLGLAKYYAAGGSVDWNAYFTKGHSAVGSTGIRAIEAPTYPFKGTSFWISPKAGSGSAAGIDTGLPVLGRELSVAQLNGVFETEVSWSKYPYLRHHQIVDALIAPGSFHVEIILEYIAHSNPSYYIHDLSIQRPLYVDEHVARKVQLLIDEVEMSDGLSAKIYSTDAAGGDWTLHVSANLKKQKAAPAGAEVNIDGLKAGLGTEITPSDFYKQLADIGFHYGTSFQGVKSLQASGSKVLGKLELNPDQKGGTPYQLHPCLLDAAFQLLMAVEVENGSDKKETYLPIAVEQLQLQEVGLESCYALLDAPQASSGAEIISCVISLFAENGAPAGSLKFMCKKASPQQILAGSSRLRQDWMYDVQWAKADIDGIEKRPDNLMIICDDMQAEKFENFLLGVKNRGIPHTVVNDWQQAQALLFTADFDALAVMWDTAFEADDQLAEEVRNTALKVLEMSQDLIRLESERKGRFFKRIYWITSHFTDAPYQMASAPVWGIGRALSRETSFDLKIIDTDGHESSAETLAEVMFIPSSENQVRIQKGQAQVLRLAKHRKPSEAARSLTAQSTYLITGATGDLGIQAVQWLAKNTEIQHLMLLARRTPKPEVQKVLDEITASGRNVSVHSVDVSDAAAVKSAIAGIAAEWPLKGVIHIAGTASDAPIPEQSEKTFDHVLNPKMKGAWNLHLATKDLDLEVFSMYSSLSGLAGVPGTSNYAAANTFLDVLAAYRRHTGKVGHSINWGAWAGATGLLDEARVDDFKKYMRSRGLNLIEAEGGNDILGYTLTQPGLLNQTLVAPLILDTPAPFKLPSGEIQPIYRNLFAQAAADAPQSSDELGKLRKQLFKAAPEERYALLASAIKKQVAMVTRIEDAEGIDVDADLFSLGIDSLMAAEMVSRLSQMIKEPLAPTIIFDQRTVNDLTTFMLEVTIDFSTDEAEADEEQEAPARVSEGSAAVTLGSNSIKASNGEHEQTQADWEEMLRDVLKAEIAKRGMSTNSLEESWSINRSVKRLASSLKKRLK